MDVCGRLVLAQVTLSYTYYCCIRTFRIFPYNADQPNYDQRMQLKLLVAEDIHQPNSFVWTHAMQGMRDAWEEMRDRAAAATNQRVAYLQHGFALAWKEGIHTDFLVKPGNGPPIPPHKAILVSLSRLSDKWAF
jgi:hypothetical protein